MKEQENEAAQGLISNSVKEDRPIVSKKWKTTLINYIIISAFTNFIFAWYIGKSENITHLGGGTVSKAELARSLFIGFFVLVPILGFILGTITTYLPFKNATYSEKYLPISLLTILTIEVIMILIRIAILV